jgi:hypothetical protein
MTMTNKGSFKTLSKDAIISEYSDGIKIYLESTDDQYIFKVSWFSKFNDKLSFESASDSQEGGGCQMVLKKVRESRAPAFGVVDRDILLVDKNFQDTLWWEVSDEVFSSTKPYGDDIFVLHRWELENYLLHPETLATLVAEKKLKTTTIAAEEIANLLAEKEDELLAVTVLSTLSTKKEKTISGGDRCFLDKSGDELKLSVQEHLQVNLQIENRQIEQEQDRIKRFAVNENYSVKRWHNLSRMLDGKKIMHRIEKLLFSGGVKLESERGNLAGHIARNRLIDMALTNWLENIYDSAI